MIIYLVGLMFLIYFSFLDLRHSKVNNSFIGVFFILGLYFLLMEKSWLILALMLFNLLFFGGLWYFNSLGGADVKILAILPIYSLIGCPNIITGQIFFLALIFILGLVYYVCAKLILKSKYIPFIPLITISYLVLGVIRLFWI